VNALVNASGRAQRQKTETKSGSKKGQVDTWATLPPHVLNLELVCFAAAPGQTCKAYEARHTTEGRGNPVSQFFGLILDLQISGRIRAPRPHAEEFQSRVLLQLRRTRQTDGKVSELVCSGILPLEARPTAAGLEETFGCTTTTIQDKIAGGKLAGPQHRGSAALRANQADWRCNKKASGPAVAAPAGVNPSRWSLRT
jgi:hypothetical protein